MARHARRHHSRSAFMRDMVRSWRHSWQPFLSLIAITLLGVAVLTGIYAGCQDTFRAANDYYTKQGLHDLEIVSTLGLTQDDVNALRDVSGVSSVQATRSQSVEYAQHGSTVPLTLQEIGTNGIDQPYVMRGSMPTKSGEAAVEEQFVNDTGLDVGDSFTVTEPDDSSDTSTNASESTSATANFPKTYKITAVVMPADDLTNTNGYMATNGIASASKTAGRTVYVPADGVSGDVYTAIILQLNNTRNLSTFSDEYTNAVDAVANRISADVKQQRQDARRTQLVDDAQRQLDDAKQQANQQFADAQQKIDDQRRALQAAGARAAMSGAAQQITAAQQELDTKKADAEREFAAEQQKINDIGTATWYIRDRADLTGYSSLKSDMTSIESLGNAFPIVFLVVAVMMGLTLITRLVEEDRTLFGTYLALGYPGRALVARYVAFAVVACLIGGILGMGVGFYAIPAVLLTVIRGLYLIPNMTMEISWPMAIFGILLFVIGVGIAATVAAAREARHNPASLMRPKSPKAGARILLERVTFLWKRMKFLNKVTARNMFRFKSRLIMTVGGVAGCTALIVCALAINDTVAALGPSQYNNIYQYDVMAVSGDNDADELFNTIDKSGKATEIMRARIETGTLGTVGSSSSASSTTVQLTIIPDAQRARLADMINLQAASTESWWTTLTHLFDHSSGVRPGDTVELDNNGIIVAQSVGQSLDLHSGGEAQLTDANGDVQTVPVHAVTRNLIGTDVFITQSEYRKLFGTAGSGSNDSAESGNSSELVWNAVYAKLSGNTDNKIQYGEQLADNAIVVSSMSTAKQARDFGFDLMGAVIAVIVALAGGLALVVLFTLSQTNVAEREREMATLKVLGFYDREVHRYVHREMIDLTIIGIIVGLPVGYWVSGLLTSALNMPGIYFEVTVKPISYVIAAAVTLAFAWIVQLCINPTLDHIDPVSSLKSVE